MSSTADSEAFLALYTELAPKVFAYLVIRTGHRPTAEDLLSQAWLKAWKAWPTARRENPKGWVFQIAHNILVDHYRQSPEIAWDELASVTDVTTDDMKNDLAEVRRSLQKLTSEQRDIIIMRVWDGLTFDEIATILHISAPAAKMRYQRGVATLGSLLSLLTLFYYANIT